MTRVVARLDITFEADLPWWLLVAAGAVLVGAALVFYLRVRGNLKPGMLAVLLGLRMLAVVSLLVLFLRPVFRFDTESVLKGELLVLLDDSKSMSVQDYPSEPNRLEQAKREVTGTKGFAAEAGEDFNIHYYGFSSGLEALRDERAVSDLKPTGEGTHLAGAVAKVLGGHDRANVSAVVVLTDGNDNSAGDPVQTLEKIEVPVYWVGVGTRMQPGQNYRDILITDVKTEPERYLTVNNRARVNVYLKSVGYANLQKTLLLTEKGGSERGRTTVVLDDTGQTRKVTLELTPTTVGRFTYEVSIAPESDERFSDNNRQTFTVHVTDPKVKVLYLDKPGEEFRWLNMTLQKDPNVELVTLVNDRVGRFTQRGNAPDEIKLTGFPATLEELNVFDVLVMGNVERSYFSREQLEAVKTFVMEGKGLVMTGGQHTFGMGGYGGTPLEEVLPVNCGSAEIGQMRDEFTMELTASGKGHDVFAGTEKHFGGKLGGLATEALELRGCNRVAGVKPAGTILARQKGDEGLPVLVVAQVGKGRSAALLATGTYKWYWQFLGLGEESPYVRFWGQLVRWLAGREPKEREADAGITVTIDKDVYAPGEKVSLTVNVRDSEGLVTENADVEARFEGPNNLLAPLKMLYNPMGRNYTEVFDPPGPGEYAVTVTAKDKEGKTLGTQKHTFIVGKPSLESEEVDLNDALLRQLAAGFAQRAYYPLAGIHQIHSKLAPLVKRRHERPTYPVPTWLRAVLFLGFVGLLTTEWALRRRWQLL